MSEDTRSGNTSRGELMRSCLAYFAAVSFGLAQPLYSEVARSYGVISLGVKDIALIILLVQIGPTVALLLVRMIVGSRRFIIDMVVYSAAALSVGRQIQLAYFRSAAELPTAMKFSILAVTLVFIVAAIYWLRRYLMLYMTYLGVLALVFPVYFVWSYQMQHLPQPASLADPQPAPDRKTPDKTVFIFIFDELSLSLLLDDTGMVDPNMFPNLHRFSRESIWFREAIANYAFTVHSIPSMLTGSFVRRVSLDDSPEPSKFPQPNLLSVLWREGYRVNVYSRSWGCWEERAMCVRHDLGRGTVKILQIIILSANKIVPQFLSYRIFPTWVTTREVLEGQMLSRVGRGEFANPGNASLFHFLFSHSPYYLSVNGIPVPSKDTSFGPQADVGRVLTRYREQVKYLDRQFGLFLDGLKKSGAWKRSVIVVTADHGECWRPGCMGRVNHISAVEPSLARVPMMIRAPHLKPRILDNDYQHIDFYPTVLDVLGISAPDSAKVDGRSALAPALSKRPRYFFLDEDLKELVELSLPPQRVEIVGR